MIDRLHRRFNGPKWSRKNIYRGRNEFLTSNVHRKVFQRSRRITTRLSGANVPLFVNNARGRSLISLRLKLPEPMLSPSRDLSVPTLWFITDIYSSPGFVFKHGIGQNDSTILGRDCGVYGDGDPLVAGAYHGDGVGGGGVHSQQWHYDTKHRKSHGLVTTRVHFTGRLGWSISNGTWSRSNVQTNVTLAARYSIGRGHPHGSAVGGRLTRCTLAALGPACAPRSVTSPCLAMGHFPPPPLSPSHLLSLLFLK
ncbi:hypothetical protein J6590_001117 [Homalodisca vitripennis]|nr:hypothetical protein J6590_001117 [Homalodisca vitripennis]